MACCSQTQLSKWTTTNWDKAQTYSSYVSDWLKSHKTRNLTENEWNFLRENLLLPYLLFFHIQYPTYNNNNNNNNNNNKNDLCEDAIKWNVTYSQ